MLHLALRAKVGTVDPVRCGSQYDNAVVSAIYEPLFQYEYLERPYRLVPNLAAAMPEVSPDLLEYTIALREGVYFHDDPAFAGGHGRELTAEDVVFSIKRMANRDFSPSGWWIYNGRIAGFDAYKEAQNARPAGAAFDYDAPVEGLEVLDRYHLRIRLLRPFPQLLDVLGMCYASVVPREVVLRYGADLARHAVGTGPFRLVELIPGTKVVLAKNPRYRDVRYPTAEHAEPGDEARGLLEAAGARVPFLDGVVMHVFEQDQPMWLKWRVKDLDFIQTPTDFFDAAFDETGSLRPALAEEGVGVYVHAKLDFIYRGFNMEDPVVGGMERGKLLRQAISLAMDTEELADAFYNRTVIRYDGPIPPGLDGYEPGVLSPYRGPNLEKAKELLARAGYPEGRGLPRLAYHTNRGGSSPAQAEMFARQLRRVGIELDLHVHSFPELDALIKKKQAQMFNLSWGSDYPDAENNLALFYGPNRVPGSNNFNYSNPEYDALYEQIRTMAPSPERTAIYRRMRDLVIEDCPAIGSMARTRYFVWNRRVRNLKPDETWYTWLKFVDVDPLEP